ncbi:hypothetical protein ZWY2020_018390 [Hordeum vulgare]|nr:hypothetical protein ZWY2020_018390 [Hordeum vulgare]
MLENSFLIDTRMKKFDTIVSGHPISKPIWTDLSDWDILDRFGRIFRNFFIIVDLRKNGLSRKHKSTVRTFMQRLGSTFLEEFVMEEGQVFSLMFTKTTLFFFQWITH